MAISRKRKRKIIYNNKEYFWYIRKDRYYDSSFFIDYRTPLALHIISVDKQFILYVPVNVEKPYILGNIQTKLLPERIFLPFSVPEIITPKFVSDLIVWANENLNSIDSASDTVI